MNIAHLTITETCTEGTELNLKFQHLGAEAGRFLEFQGYTRETLSRKQTKNKLKKKNKLMLSINYQWHIIAWPFVSLDFSKLWQLTNVDRIKINIPVVWTLFCLTDNWCMTSFILFWVFRWTHDCVFTLHLHFPIYDLCVGSVYWMLCPSSLLASMILYTFNP